jgi:hypothetical protein
MDELGLEILKRELDEDCRVAAEAAAQAIARTNESHPGHLEAAAFEAARFYNILERMLERICVAFENQFEKRGDYHERLLQRLALDLPGFRPAFLPQEALPDLREVKGFRHVIRHAYDLVLQSDRLQSIVKRCQCTAEQLPGWCERFVASVRSEQGWSADPPSME